MLSYWFAMLFENGDFVSPIPGLELFVVIVAIVSLREDSLG